MAERPDQAEMLQGTLDMLVLQSRVPVTHAVHRLPPRHQLLNSVYP